MSRKVVWSVDALTDLGDILEFVAESDERYALRLVDRLEAAGNKLGLHATGRPGRVGHMFEKSLPELNYILAYEVDDVRSVLTVLRVIHSHRDWPKGRWPE